MSRCLWKAVGAAAALSVLVGAALAAQLDVPMDDSLVTVLIRFGLKDTQPAQWSGQYRVVGGGQIIATDGWRFTGGDFATTSQFRLQVRRFYPRFWRMHGLDPSKLRTEPNGVLLTFKGLQPDSKLEVETDRGRFTVPVGQLKYGEVRKTLDGQIEYQRLPVSRQIVRAATEDAYPAALSTEDGTISVAYIAFKHGKGFEVRPPIKEVPDDFSFLAAPTGGDRVLFTECRNGRWSEPVALTEPGDLFGTAIARDGQGRLWVFWSQNVDENWDLFAAVRENGRWSKPLRVTTAAGSDFFHVATTDSEGRIWLAWQHFGSGQSDIWVARQEGDRFGKPEPVGQTSGNDWKPAIAASSDGRVAVAWDSYERGNYDVFVRTWEGGRWSEPVRVAGTNQNEARADVVFDRNNRLWVTYEVSPEGWGKDYGPYDQSPRRLPLYRQRSVGLKVLDRGVLYEPVADVNLALPLAGGRRRGPRNRANRSLSAGPKLAVDRAGRVYLLARIRVASFDSDVGGTWMNYFTTLDGDRWLPAVLIPETDGFLHETAVPVPAPESGLYFVSSSDGRFRDAAFFGQPKRKKGRGAGRNAPAKKTAARKHPPTTRTYVTYPDRLFNKELSLAQTGPMPRPAQPPALRRVEPDRATGPTEAARKEAEAVAAIRNYRVTIGGKTLRLWRGEFHRHTEFSSDGGGDGSIFDMWRYAIDLASLDWIGNGDHDNGNGREFSWWMIQKTTSLMTVPGAFTPMYSYERSCGYPDGHRNAVFARRGIRPLGRLVNGRGKAMDNLPPDAPRPHTPDTLMFYKYLHFFGGVCASHTSGTNMGTDWRDNDPLVEPVVEIYQGDRQSYERPGAPRSNSADYSIGGWRPYGFVSLALMKGYRLGFQSSSDHISTHMSYCNVWVEEPTREQILEGLRKRHVYGSTDNIIADVRCGDHFMGDEFETDKPPTLHVKLIGTAPFEEVVIVKDNQYVYSIKPNKRVVEFTWTDNQAEPGKTSYYYVRGKQVGTVTEKTVRSPDGRRVKVQLDSGELVWVSPMWITYRP